MSLTLTHLIGFGGRRGGVGGNDASTKLLLNCDGADGATTFADSAAGAGTAHNGTAVGNAQVDTAQSKFGGASMLLDGTGDYVTVAGHSDFNFGTGDLTVDFWMRANSLVSNGYILDWRGAAGTGPLFLCFLNVAGTGMDVYIGGATLTVANGTFSTGTWYHIALVRTGTTVKVFVDGVEKDSDTGSSSINATSHALYIGSRYTAEAFWNGWLDEIRVSNIARWTTAFTPPSAAYSS